MLMSMKILMGILKDKTVMKFTLKGRSTVKSNFITKITKVQIVFDTQHLRFQVFNILYTIHDKEM